MYLGIEIGGTKLQLGVGTKDDAQLIELERRSVDADAGASGIREQIEEVGTQLLNKHPDIQRIGIGFGGPVDSAAGKVHTSHQIDGWDDFPLVDWTRDNLQRDVVMGNDCDCATLGEATCGAGRDAASVFYVTVGTGVGGGFYTRNVIHGFDRPSAAEIGHLRPGLQSTDPSQTVESLASGWGIANQARNLIASTLAQPVSKTQKNWAEELQLACNYQLERLDVPMVAAAALNGNLLAASCLNNAIQSLGWAIAQVITLLAPELVIVGGGVSLLGEEQFYAPLREQVEKYLFSPLRDSYRIVKPQLDEAVVVHGAIALARSSQLD